jgi:hypothetical protein
LREPLDDPANTEFVSVLDVVNQLAEVTPGFVWRLQADDGGASSYIKASEDPLLIVNLTVWHDIETLRHFTYKSGHGAYFRRRREWFEPATEATMVCWWVPVGHTPSLADALRRLEALRLVGPGPDGFLFTDPMPAPG